jgi:hypothetical protein
MASETLDTSDEVMLFFEGYDFGLTLPSSAFISVQREE